MLEARKVVGKKCGKKCGVCPCKDTNKKQVQWSPPWERKDIGLVLF
jgi:hypothetical protein